MFSESPDRRPRLDLCARTRRGPIDATDDALLANARQGDGTAFAELFDRHRHDARRYARRLAAGTLGSDAADDIVSDAVRNMLIAIRRGGGPVTGFRPYLFSAIRSVAIKAHAKARTERSVVSSCRDTATASADDSLDGVLVMAAFETLPERLQRVLWATEVHDLSPADVARRTGMRRNTIAVRARRAREALRIAYARECLPAPTSPSCKDALGLLARGAVMPLADAHQARLDAHVAVCTRCRAAAIDIPTGLAAPMQPTIVRSHPVHLPEMAYLSVS